MKPAPFIYKRCESVEHVTALLAEYGDEASILAGGQSLIALMNLRFAVPTVLLDIGRIEGLADLHCDDEAVEVGALVRAQAVERSADVTQTLPVLGDAVRLIGHPQIRSRTTIGGNVAHADPASELPALLLGLDGEVELRSQSAVRRVQASSFFEGMWETCREPSELLSSVRFPSYPNMRKRFVEFARRPGDFALAGVFVGIELNSAAEVAELRLAFCGVDSTPVRLAAVEAGYKGHSVTAATPTEIAASASDALDPFDIPECPADYRRNLCRVLVERAVEDLLTDGVPI